MSDTLQTWSDVAATLAVRCVVQHDREGWLVLACWAVQEGAVSLPEVDTGQGVASLCGPARGLYGDAR